MWEGVGGTDWPWLLIIDMHARAGRSHIAVTTIEKANSIVNLLIKEGSIGQLTCLVVDEMHMMGGASVWVKTVMGCDFAHLRVVSHFVISPHRLAARVPAGAAHEQAPVHAARRFARPSSRGHRRRRRSSWRGPPAPALAPGSASGGHVGDAAQPGGGTSADGDGQHVPCR